MAKAYLALGTNLGDRVENLITALDLIRQKAQCIKTSSLYETEPVGVKEQPWFLNQAAQVETDLPPLELLDFLKGVERQMGREKAELNGPRLIDLDILFYENLILHTSELTIPHPRLYLRNFVLEPLNEIAPEFIHPVLGLSVRELKSGLNSPEWAVKLNPEIL